MEKNIRVLASILLAAVFLLAGCGMPSGNSHEERVAVHVDNGVPRDLLLHFSVSKGVSKQVKQFNFSVPGAENGIGMPKTLVLTWNGDEADSSKPDIRVEVFSDPEGKPLAQRIFKKFNGLMLSLLIKNGKGRIIVEKEDL